MIRMMKSDDEIGMVPPLAYLALGGNYAIIRMMEAEQFPLLPILPVGGTIPRSELNIGMVPPLL